MDTTAKTAQKAPLSAPGLQQPPQRPSRKPPGARPPEDVPARRFAPARAATSVVPLATLAGPAAPRCGPPRSLRSLVRSLLRRGRIERPAPFIPTRGWTGRAHPWRLVRLAHPWRLSGQRTPGGWPDGRTPGGWLDGRTPGGWLDGRTPTRATTATSSPADSLVRFAHSESLARAFLARAPPHPPTADHPLGNPILQYSK